MSQQLKISLDGCFLEVIRVSWLQFSRVAVFFANVLVLILLGEVILRQVKFNPFN